MSSASAAVAAANNLTARWCGSENGAHDFVVSGAGLWPLLALLASAATGPARAELGAALGTPADSATADALAIIETIDHADAAAAALGLWLRPGHAPADSDWAAALPADVLGTRTDQAALDAWVARHTDGAIDRFPLAPQPRDAVVLASALSVKTKWRQVFSPITCRAEQGPWRGRGFAALHRSTAELDAITLLAGRTPVTRAVVAGVDDVDVHLLLGLPNADAGDVLATGLAALNDTAPGRSADELAIGDEAAGLRVTGYQGVRDQVSLTVPPFDIRSAHDLCADPDRFGLAAAMRPDGHAFPRLDPELFVSRGAQHVLATFSWEGFRAAAVTAFAMQVASMMRPPDRTARRVAVVFDRPFGFVAVHRPSALALVAGWIATAGTG